MPWPCLLPGGLSQAEMLQVLMPFPHTQHDPSSGRRGLVVYFKKKKINPSHFEVVLKLFGLFVAVGFGFFTAII